MSLRVLGKMDLAEGETGDREARRTAAARASIRDRKDTNVEKVNDSAGNKDGEGQAGDRGECQERDNTPQPAPHLEYLPAPMLAAESRACATVAETVHFPSLPHFLQSVAPMGLPGSSL